MRHTAAECIGFLVGWDVNDIRDGRYHYGRTAVPVYVVGNDYMCCPSKGKPPKGWEWKEYGQAYGKTVYIAP